MCAIDYYDGEGGVCLGLGPRKARKEHRCDDCGRTISKGETYTYGRWAGGEYEDFMTAKVCEHCCHAGQWLKAICGGHLWPGVCEELREHWAEEWSLRSLGLGRLVIAVDHRKGRPSWTDHNGDLLPLDLIDAWVADALAHVPDEAMSTRSVGEAS